MESRGIQTTSAIFLLRRRDVEQRTGLGRSAIYERLASGQFPRPVRVGARGVRWVAAEVEQWIAERIANRPAAAPQMEVPRGP